LRSSSAREICASFPVIRSPTAAQNFCGGLRIIRQPVMPGNVHLLFVKQVAHIRQISRRCANVSKSRARYCESVRYGQYRSAKDSSPRRTITSCRLPFRAALANSSEASCANAASVIARKIYWQPRSLVRAKPISRRGRPFDLDLQANFVSCPA
jgi:hypothetical protein